MSSGKSGKNATRRRLAGDVFIANRTIQDTSRNPSARVSQRYIDVDVRRPGCDNASLPQMIESVRIDMRQTERSPRYPRLPRQLAVAPSPAIAATQARPRSTLRFLRSRLVQPRYFRASRHLSASDAIQLPTVIPEWT